MKECGRVYGIPLNMNISMTFILLKNMYTLNLPNARD